MTFAWLIAPAGMLAMAVMFQLSPHLARPEIFFAVNVGADFGRSDEGRRIVSSFRRTLWINTIAAAILAAVVSPLNPLWVPAALAWQMAATFAALIIGHRRALRHAQPQGIREIDIAPPRQLPAGYLHLLPFAVIGAAAVYVALRWNAIPDRFPMHWDAAGQPDGWHARSLAGVFAPALAGFVGCAFLGILSIVITRTSRAGTPADRTIRNVTLRILLAVQLVTSVVAAWTLLLPIAPGVRAYAIGIPVLVLLVVVGSIGAAIVTTRRLTAGGGDLTPDACWKGGLVYYNPADPALFVQKRIGIGYTLNFGNRWAWIMMILMVLPGLTIAFMTSR